MIEPLVSSEPEVIAIGSVHMDLLATAQRVPAPGESVLGTSFAMYPGGKAGNQAIAAARQGARTVIVARLGNDAFGHELQAALDRKGVETSWLQMDEREPTGASPILMGADGTYTSIIVPGASRSLSPAHLAPIASRLRAPVIVMMQLEIDLATTLEAARLASLGKARVLLNASPIQSAASLPAGLWSWVDTVIVNREEAARLLGQPEVAQEKPVLLARELRGQLGVPAVVVTLGAEGVVLSDREGEVALPGYAVPVADTIGAGDVFAGALAAALARGVTLREAVRLANAAGALAVGKLGPYDAAPTLAEAMALLEARG